MGAIASVCAHQHRCLVNHPIPTRMKSPNPLLLAFLFSVLAPPAAAACFVWTIVCAEFAMTVIQLILP